MRKIHLILTIGGGFVGLVINLQALFTAEKQHPMYYALITVFMALYGYGIFAGLRLADCREDKKHLKVFYWLQVPWISSPLIAYRFTSGINITGGFVDWRFSGSFRVGSDWQFSFFHSAPWGIGVNIVALIMVILLMRKGPNPVAEPTPMTVTSANDAPIAQDIARDDFGSGPETERSN